jgi:hypothetical protein
MFEAEHKLDLKIARDSQPVGSSTTNNSAITIQTNTESKEINTPLAGFVLLLTVGTYWLLMRYTTTLSNEIVLPSKLVEDNIAAILSQTWPKHYIGSRGEHVDDRLFVDWTLFYKEVVDLRKPDRTPIRAYSPKGLLDIREGIRESCPSLPMASFKIFSPVMKGLVHVAIWNSISFWLVLVMVVNTLVYNGFVSNNITNDSTIRLLFRYLRV